MSEKRDAHGVPLGEAPETVQRQREATRLLLADAQANRPKGPGRKAAKTTPPSPEEVVTESAANPEDHQDDAPPAPEAPVAPAAPKPATAKWNRKAITLEHTLISFELEILEFSVTNRFLTVIFEKSVKMPDPTEPTRFKLHINGRAYPVEHMGINFDIPTLGLRGVSFLLVEDSK